MRPKRRPKRRTVSSSTTRCPQAEVADRRERQGLAGISLPPVTVPGTYVVQAGAFPDFAEADKVKARLALLGIVAEIQTAEADGRTLSSRPYRTDR